MWYIRARVSPLGDDINAVSLWPNTARTKTRIEEVTSTPYPLEPDFILTTITKEKKKTKGRKKKRRRRRSKMKTMMTDDEDGVDKQKKKMISNHNSLCLLKM
jgi:ribosomal protein L23